MPFCRIFEFISSLADKHDNALADLIIILFTYGIHPRNICKMLFFRTMFKRSYFCQIYLPTKRLFFEIIFNLTIIKLQSEIIASFTYTIIKGRLVIYGYACRLLNATLESICHAYSRICICCPLTIQNYTNIGMKEANLKFMLCLNLYT